MPIELVMLSNHLILSCLLLLLASIFPIIRFFLVSWLLALGGQDIGASASALVLPVNLQKHHSSKASILWCSASFIVQVSHPTGKTYSIFSNNLSYPPHLSLHSAHQAAKEYYFPHFPVAKYNHSTDVVVAVTASKDIQVLIPGTCESSLCGNRLLANVVELRISRWRDYSGLWGDSQRQSQMSLWNRDQEVWHTEEKKVMWPQIAARDAGKCSFHSEQLGAVWTCTTTRRTNWVIIDIWLYITPCNLPMFKTPYKDNMILILMVI